MVRGYQAEHNSNKNSLIKIYNVECKFV